MEPTSEADLCQLIQSWQLSSLSRLTRFILPKEKALAKNYCRLGELKELNNIRGSLCIENLGSVTDAVAESRAANLIGKHSLESLALDWGYFNTDDVAIVDRDEALLGGLQPHSSLQKLTINGYKGESFPRWMMDRLVSSLPYLVEDLPKLASLPQWLLQASNLERLSILVCKELDICKDESGNLIILDSHGGLHHSLRSVHLSFLPKLASLPQWLLQLSNLEDLSIEDCKELDICKDESGNLIILDSHGGLHHGLRSVDLSFLPKLASLPVASLGPAISASHHRRNCRELDICKDESGNLIILDSHGGLHHSLRSVDLSFLPKLASLPQWLLQLGNLECLEIRYCRELDICKDESGNLIILDSHGGLHHSLRSVRIEFLPKLASLPSGFSSSAISSISQSGSAPC
ncbi:hypothetical protein NL676_029750 [Syzygium grande]|nr:hypothetical protein NL676_029750 [Syzygium grande]